MINAILILEMFLNNQTKKFRSLGSAQVLGSYAFFTIGQYLDKWFTAELNLSFQILSFEMLCIFYILDFNN